MTALLTMDGNLLLWIQDCLRSPLLTPLMRVVTHLGDHGAFWILLTLALLIPKKTRKAALCSGAALFLMVVLNNMIIKHAVARTRPYEVIEGLRILVGKPDGYSFPSGHSSSSFASSVALYRNLPKQYRGWGVALLVLAAVIACSRLYVGVHYPSDVLFGVLSGILYGILGGSLVHWFLRGFPVRGLREWVGKWL